VDKNGEIQKKYGKKVENRGKIKVFLAKALIFLYNYDNVFF